IVGSQPGLRERSSVEVFRYVCSLYKHVRAPETRVVDRPFPDSIISPVDRHFVPTRFHLLDDCRLSLAILPEYANSRGRAITELAAPHHLGEIADLGDPFLSSSIHEEYGVSLNARH